MALALLAVAALLNFQSCQAPDDGAQVAGELAAKCLAVQTETATQLGQCRERLAQITPCPADDDGGGS